MNTPSRRASGTDATADDLARANMHRALRIAREAIPAGTADPDSIRAAMEERELVTLFRVMSQADRREVLQAAYVARCLTDALRRVGALPRGAAPSRGEEPAP
jgi:hypothetical protein